MTAKCCQFRVKKDFNVSRNDLEFMLSNNNKDVNLINDSQ